MDSALYNRDILRLATALEAGDRLQNPDGTAECRSPICGSRIAADVNLKNDGVIAEIALRANACALGQASAAILRSNAVGVDMAAIANIRDDIEMALKKQRDMPQTWHDLAILTPAREYPSRHAAILLPYDALLAAAEHINRTS
jgi:NifU-like protein involved in Fe-S cluster formation